MLFQSSIRRELARSFGATFVVLMTIVLTIVLIRTLGQASRGVISPQDVMLFMAYAALGRLSTILTLSLFIALVTTLMRMYRDSEMVVWLSSGKSLMSFLSPLFRFSWPVLLIIALSAIFVWPWTNNQTKTMQESFGNRSDIDRIAPGQFQESSNGNRVFFIDREAKTDQKSSNNVFIAANEKGKNSVTTARTGRIELMGDNQMLILENGQRLESENGKSALKISDFKEYGSNTGSSATLNSNIYDAKLMSIPVLVKSPTRANLSELAWRLGLALAAINFVVIALAVANANPRSGRSGTLIFAILAFMVYNNLVNLGQSWVFGGLVTFTNLLLLLHGGVLALALMWLAKRNANWTLRAAFFSRNRRSDSASNSSGTRLESRA